MFVFGQHDVLEPSREWSLGAKIMIMEAGV